MVDRISPEEAKRRMDEEGWIFVDVRSRPEFEQGHPTGAYNVPLLHINPDGIEPNPDFMSVMEKAFDKDARLILGCRSGGRSLRAAQMLEAAGWTHVVDQRAGWDGVRTPFGQLSERGWVASALPTSTEPEPGRGYPDLERAG